MDTNANGLEFSEEDHAYIVRIGRAPTGEDLNEMLRENVVMRNILWDLVNPRSTTDWKSPQTLAFVRQVLDGREKRMVARRLGLGETPP